MISEENVLLGIPDCKMMATSNIGSSYSVIMIIKSSVLRVLDKIVKTTKDNLVDLIVRMAINAIY